MVKAEEKAVPTKPKSKRTRGKAAAKLEPEPEPEPEPALPESGAGVELKPQYGEAIATAPNSLHALQPDWSLLHAW